MSVSYYVIIHHDIIFNTEKVERKKHCLKGRLQCKGNVYKALKAEAEGGVSCHCGRGQEKIMFSRKFLTST